MFKGKTDPLKLWECALLIALSVTLCLGAWAQGRQSAISSKLVRLHVIAASDEEAEQALKLRVRDAVLEYLSPRLIGAADSNQARAILREELEGIRLAAESAAEGRQVTVALSRERYPTKRYEGFTLPAGNTSPSGSPWERAKATTGGALCSRRCVSPPVRATRWSSSWERRTSASSARAMAIPCASGPWSFGES